MTEPLRRPRMDERAPRSAGAELFHSLRDSRLSVIVPVFNEARDIAANLELLVSEVDPYFDDFEVLVISDGSTDGTHEVLSTFRHDRVRTIHFDQNRGKGAVVREGLRQAAGDYLLFIDGGMELHPKEIRIFLGLMELYAADVVVGSKRHPQSKIEYPVYRRFLSSLYQLIIRRLFGLDVTDTQVGMKLFRRDVVEAILPDLRIDRYGFDLEVLALARARGFRKFLEAPIELDYFQSKSRSMVGDLLHVLRVGASVLADTWRLYRRIRGLGRP